MAVLQLIVHSVMNSAGHSGRNTAYSAQCYEQSSTVVVIQVIVHSVMNTAAHSGSNTAYSAHYYELSSTQWP